MDFVYFPVSISYSIVVHSMFKVAIRMDMIALTASHRDHDNHVTAQENVLSFDSSPVG